MSSIVVAGDTSGSITIAAPAVSGSNTLTLPAVTDTIAGIAATQTLTNKSIAATQLTGTIAVGRLPAGSVIQVVNATYAVSTTNVTTTYADTGLTATITPSSATSKILVLINQVGVSSTNTTSGTNVQLLKNASVLALLAGYYNYTVANITSTVSTCYLDSPATTSATIYKTQFARAVGAGTSYVQDNSSTSTITLMEIAV